MHLRFDTPEEARKFAHLVPAIRVLLGAAAVLTVAVKLVPSAPELRRLGSSPSAPICSTPPATTPPLEG